MTNEAGPRTSEVPGALTHRPHGGAVALTIGAMGVVYGDIGTSPLYAVNEIFFGHGNVARTADNVIGCISLIIWTITLVVALKYLVFVLRADNDGEGGTFALYGLLHTHRRRGLTVLLSLLMLAAGLLFGEGIITPAISVLSAVEGLEVATPAFARLVVPITLTILTVLFLVQRKGTAQMGKVFGPIIVCWFSTIGILGVLSVLRHPGILAALDPRRGLGLLWHVGPGPSLHILGGVVLAITGGEALYADMGHLGARPIRVSWGSLVYPALVATYLGQGAHLLGGEPVTKQNVFYSLVPTALVLPMVVLATCATVIASQALISGAFSLAAQATALGLFPRLRIVHTHHAHAGQIYVPFINWALFVGCVTLVLRFGSSTNLAAAYGLSVSGVMLSTSIAMTAIARLYWHWKWPVILLVFVPLGLIDLSFLSANALKFFDGGFIPLSLGVLLFVVMTTWRWGRRATFAAYSGKRTMTMEELVRLKETATLFDRNAVVMVPKPLTSIKANAPALMQLLYDRSGALPKNIIFVEVVHKKVPYLNDESARYRVNVFQRSETKGCIVSVTIVFGFMEEPNIEAVLESLAGHHQIDLPADPHKWIVHASHENVMPAASLGPIGRLRLRLFAVLRQISQPSYYYHGLGNEVQLSTEIMPVKLR